MAFKEHAPSASGLCGPEDAAIERVREADPARCHDAGQPEGPSRTVCLGGQRILQRAASRRRGCSPPPQDRARSHNHDTSRVRPSVSRAARTMARIRHIVKNRMRTHTVSSPAVRRTGKGIHDQAPRSGFPSPSAALRPGMTLSSTTTLILRRSQSDRLEGSSKVH
jgi:hypothetical protein